MKHFVTPWASQSPPDQLHLCGSYREAPG